MQPDNLDPNEMFEQMDFQNKQLQQKNLELAGALTSSGFSEQEEQNLIHYQLETDKILERIEHFLKGDQIRFNDKGAYFAEPTRNVLAIKKRDPESKITYYIQELKEGKKGTEFIKEVLVKLVNKDNDGINVFEQDSKRILEKIKKIKLQDSGYEYIEVLDEDKKPLNEYGVAELMRIISMYVTKETFLSYYDQDRINEIMGDLGDALNKFMYCNYEKMGMDTKFKESKYIMICINILHTIESCYRRALGGNEQENLRTRAIVTQNQGSGGSFGGFPRSSPKKNRWSPFKPSTW